MSAKVVILSIYFASNSFKKYGLILKSHFCLSIAIRSSLISNALRFNSIKYHRASHSLFALLSGGWRVDNLLALKQKLICVGASSSGCGVAVLVSAIALSVITMTWSRPGGGAACRSEAVCASKVVGGFVMHLLEHLLLMKLVGMPSVTSRRRSLHVLVAL